MKSALLMKSYGKYVQLFIYTIIPFPVLLYECHDDQSSARITISCRMNFDDYPLDAHVCQFQVGSCK